MKIKKKFLAYFCLFAHLAFAHPVNEQEELDKQTIPIEVLHGLPLVDVVIQENTLQLVLDLGSQISALSEESLKKLNLPQMRKNTYSMDIYGEKLVQPVFSSSNILIGNFPMRELEFSRANTFNSELEPDTPQELTHGKIGRGPFLNKTLFIDRKNRLCIVGMKVDPRKYAPGQWIETDFHLDKEKGICITFVTDKNGEKEFILDTGANISLINRDGLQKVPLDLRNNTEKMILKLKNGVSLGTFSFYPFDCSSAAVEGILGFDFFDRYLVCMDFVNEKLFLKPYEDHGNHRIITSIRQSAKVL